MSSSADPIRVNPWVVGLTVTLATFMEILDTSIANVSLPHIAGNLSAGIDESTWVLTSYLVANAIVLPLSGWLSSLLGRKNYYQISVVIFTVSSLLSGLAPTLGLLVVARVFQGIGGGGLQPSAQSILVDAFPREKLGMGMAIYGVAVVTAPIIGPTLGGWITDHMSWRWIFFINIPVGLLSLFLTSKFVHDPVHLKRHHKSKGFSIDYVGLSLVTLGIGALQIMLDKGQREDWFSSHLIVGLAAVAITSLVVAVIWELKREHPIVDLRLLRDRNFFLSNVLMFMLGFSLFASTVLLPLLMQTLLGYSATTAGLVLSPGGFMTMAVLPIVGFLLSKYDARLLVMIGLSIVSFSLFQMSHFNLGLDYRTAVIARIIQSGGLGFLFVPINSIAYFFIPKEKNADAAGLLNFSRNIGGSVGIALVTTFLARDTQRHQNNLIAQLTPYSVGLQNSLHRATDMLIHRGINAVQAPQFAIGLHYKQLLRQSMMLGYLDNFRLIGTIMLLTIPILFLMKKVKPHKSSDQPKIEPEGMGV